MKKQLLIFILIINGIANAQNNNFVGSYWHTEMEYAEQMHILKPHRFSWQAVYGATNQDLRGKWKVENDTIHLIFDPLPGKKHPGGILAVLTATGNLKMLKDSKKSSENQGVLKRFDKTLPEKKAAKWAKPIDYAKQIAARKTLFKKQKLEREKYDEKKKNEREQYGKYHGYFESDDEASHVVLAMNGKRKQFSIRRPNSSKRGENIYFEGTFTVENDTAYATTNSDQDEIKIYGDRGDKESIEKIKVYFRDLGSKKIIIKTGNSYSGAHFIPSTKFKEESNGLRYLQLEKADSLWAVVDELHVYSFSLQDETYHAILVQGNSGSAKPWIDRPIYVNKNNEIHAPFLKGITLKKTPQKTLIAPVSMPPSYPKLNGKKYLPIERNQISNFQK